ncbi:MAG: glycosyltransferase, partial [Acidisphaera sp.]|nr:glycosyltransferase [Acidisphaera sp.]
FPEVLETWRVVVAGKAGWLQEREAIPPVLQDAVRRKRLVFPGFVTDFQKYKLLRFADASLYPSFFEGFGLPVLESLSVGTPCVASFSSSIPEVGGEACVYFDPFSAESLYLALRHVERVGLKGSPAFVAACATLRQRFTWENMLTQILVRLVPELRRHAGV